MSIREFQLHIWKIYMHHDSRRGVKKTFGWLKREVDELGEAINNGKIENIKEELGDVLAWLSSVATLLDINLEEAAIDRYGKGCPKCGNIPCTCPYRER